MFTKLFILYSVAKGGHCVCELKFHWKTLFDLHFFSEVDNEEKLEEELPQDDNKEADSNSNNSDNDLDGFEIVDSWKDQNVDDESSDKAEIVVRKLDKSADDEEVPAKKQKLEEVEEDSDDDFAAQLLEGQLSRKQCCNWQFGALIILPPVCFVFLFQTRWWYSRELFLSNVVLWHVHLHT